MPGAEHCSLKHRRIISTFGHEHCMHVGGFLVFQAWRIPWYFWHSVEKFHSQSEKNSFGRENSFQLISFYLIKYNEKYQLWH
jgi:hypothetical protein